MDLHVHPAEDRKKATTMEMVNALDGRRWRDWAGVTGLLFWRSCCYLSFRYQTYNMSLVIWSPTCTLVSTVK